MQVEQHDAVPCPAARQNRCIGDGLGSSKYGPNNQISWSWCTAAGQQNTAAVAQHPPVYAERDQEHPGRLPAGAGRSSRGSRAGAAGQSSGRRGPAAAAAGAGRALGGADLSTAGDLERCSGTFRPALCLLHSGCLLGGHAAAATSGSPAHTGTEHNSRRGRHKLPDANSCSKCRLLHCWLVLPSEGMCWP